MEKEENDAFKEFCKSLHDVILDIETLHRTKLNIHATPIGCDIEAEGSYIQLQTLASLVIGSILDGFDKKDRNTILAIAIDRTNNDEIGGLHKNANTQTEGEED